ncbi:MAG: MBL fold metallo-hydrolase [Pseudomonadota bacterium]
MDGGRSELGFPWPEPPAPGAAIEVAPGILWMRLPLPMALDHVNVYALDDGDSWTLLDTGLDSRTSRDVWQGLLKAPLAGRPIGRVIVTHHHPDHIGLAGWFQTVHGAELLTTQTAWLSARMLVLDEQPKPVQATLDLWRGAGMPVDMLAERAKERPFNFADCVAPLPVGYRRIADGSRIKAAGRDWVVRTGNGHAPEHAMLWSMDGSLVLAGDQVLPGITPIIGVYATEPEADPLAEWLASCRELAGHATGEELVLPGHKLPFQGLALRLTELIDSHARALDRLKDHLMTARTAVECFPVLFKRQIGRSQFDLALAESMAHCLHLWHKGEVTRTRWEDGAWLWQTARN